MTTHRDILTRGVRVWNKWRKDHPSIEPELRGLSFNLYDHIFPKKNGKILIEKCDFSATKFSNSSLTNIEFNSCNFERAAFDATIIGVSSFINCDLSDVNFSEAIVRWVNFKGSQIKNSTFTTSTLVDVGLEDAVIEDCWIYGVSAWNVKTNENTVQKNLILDESKYRPPVKKTKMLVHLMERPLYR